MTTPAHTIRDGILSATIWRNHSDKGVYYSVNVQRSYKRADDAWGRTDSLYADDLLPVAELLRDAYAWIKQAKRADAKARKEGEQ